MQTPIACKGMGSYCDTIVYSATLFLQSFIFPGLTQNRTKVGVIHELPLISVQLRIKRILHKNINASIFIKFKTSIFELRCTSGNGNNGISGNTKTLFRNAEKIFI